MKNLISTFCILFSFSACGDNDEAPITCANAYDVAKPKCENEVKVLTPKWLFVERCEMSTNEDALIECTNLETCDEINACFAEMQ